MMRHRVAEADFEPNHYVHTDSRPCDFPTGCGCWGCVCADEVGAAKGKKREAKRKKSKG